jgi:hypothetical protein
VTSRAAQLDPPGEEISDGASAHGLMALLFDVEHELSEGLLGAASIVDGPLAVSPRDVSRDLPGAGR